MPDKNREDYTSLKAPPASVASLNKRRPAPKTSSVALDKSGIDYQQQVNGAHALVLLGALHLLIQDCGVSKGRMLGMLDWAIDAMGDQELSKGVIKVLRESIEKEPEAGHDSRG